MNYDKNKSYSPVLFSFNEVLIVKWFLAMIESQYSVCLKNKYLVLQVNLYLL